MKFGNTLLQRLDNYGEDAASDYDDGADAYFGWRLFYQGGDLCLKVTRDDGDGLVFDSQTWVLTPQGGSSA